MTTQQLKFGDYVMIEQLRHACDNEMYSHKVIRVINSTHWVDVPVQVPAKNTYHSGDFVGCVQCICCGVDETEVLTYRLEDIHSE
ncbi:MAG: hypothetical protein KAJ93_02420 [Methanosarcinales archaeon]|nr:hypothetical protein [Methanosarcinales archaeon]